MISLLQVNFACAINLYMTKTMQLDPPVPWGYDEKSAIIGIRIVCIGLVLGLTSTMYGLEVYPNLYYVFIGNDVSLLDLPKATLIYPTVIVSLLVNCTLLCIAARCYRTNNVQHIGEIIPKQIIYTFWTFMAVTGIIIFSGAFDNLLGLRNRWMLLQLLISLTQVITPAMVIFNDENLKSHSIKVVKEKLEDAFFLNIYLTPTILALIIYSTLYFL